ncbi:DUF3347 domain-containing protein [Cryomorpha ignava]|uniref:DUF3347 domain-containing protein n=1 Tax=Cryomorpha ignava TaxID=101383 RepID=A0A7K3WSG9_9FLAO|nr:DUF3347 domain-containing protein [Cryomorpha ignava]NEN23822.1 DUF3347 domain-containing protein [Cryomorpha ignava]
MKKSIFMFALAAMTVTACNSQTGKEEHGTESHSDEMMHDEHDGDHDQKSDKKMANTESMQIKKSDATAPLLSAYLDMKDALVNDESSKAASEGKKLYKAIESFDVEANANGQKDEVVEILADAKEHAEHISANDGNIGHQREHFETLSIDMKDLIAIAGADRELYQEYCPMYNDGQGGMWLSDNSEIRNPFYGSKMLKCGKVQAEITLK